MTRTCALLLGCIVSGGALVAQEKAPLPKQQEPVEEDEALIPKEYSFNPLQAEKELKIGNFYFKKGSYKAAANRFREASKWNPGYAEAYLRLAETEEKLNHARAADEAYRKYLDLAPNEKRAAAIRKKLAGKK